MGWERATAACLLVACHHPQRAAANRPPRPPTVDASSAAPRENTLAISYAHAIVVAVDGERSLLIAGNLRVWVAANGAIELSRQRTETEIVWARRLRDGRWLFATRDGLVLSARTFTGDFDNRAELPIALAPASEQGSALESATAVVRTRDRRWWTVDGLVRLRPFGAPRDAHEVHFVDERRVLALVSPDRALLSPDAGRTWQSLSTPGDAPLRFRSAPGLPFSIMGVSFDWALDGRSTLVRIDRSSAPRASESVERSPAGRDALARWERHWRANLWPHHAAQFALQSGPHMEHQGALFRSHKGAIHVLFRDGREREVVLDRGAACTLARFGPHVFVRCWHRSRPGTAWIVDARSLAVRSVPEIAQRDYVTAAADGSSLVLESRSSIVRRVWTLNGDWQSFDALSPDAWTWPANARVFTLGPLGVEAIETVGPRAGERSPIPAQTLDSGDGSAGSLASSQTPEARWRVLGESQSRSTVSWVLSEPSGARCFAQVLRGERVHDVPLDHCRAIEHALFVDERFGVIVYPRGADVTRDGRTWTAIAGAERVEQRADNERVSREPYVDPDDPDSIVIRPHTRVHRDARRDADEPWLRHRVTPLELRAPPLVPMRIECIYPTSGSECDSNREVDHEGSTRVLHGGGDVRVERASGGATIAVSWRRDGETRAAFRGPDPWRSALRSGQREALTVMAWAASGVIIERCVLLPSERVDACSVHLFRERAVTELGLRDASVSRFGVAAVRAVDDDSGWVVELTDADPGDARRFVQWQHIDANGLVVRWANAARYGRDERATLARIGGQWGVIVTDEDRDESDVQFVAHADGTRTSVDVPMRPMLCRESPGPNSDRWNDEGIVVVSWRAAESDAATQTTVDLRRGRNGIWCVVGLRSRRPREGRFNVRTTIDDAGWSAQCGTFNCSGTTRIRSATTSTSCGLSCGLTPNVLFL